MPSPLGWTDLKARFMVLALALSPDKALILEAMVIISPAWEN
jgi:hypothetical protein